MKASGAGSVTYLTMHWPRYITIENSRHSHHVLLVQTVVGVTVGQCQTTARETAKACNGHGFVYEGWGG